MPFALAWGVPVEADVLRAHLEAYFRTLSKVNTLKLCYRFGRGEHVSLTKLPPELVLCIADHVVQGERNRLLPRWERDFRCFQLLCDPDDHLVKSQFQRLKQKSSVGGNKGHISGRVEGMELDTCVSTLSSDEELSDDDIPRWLDVHGDRRKRWQMRSFASFNTGPFTKCKDTIHKHLGLDIWIADISVYDLRPHSWWATMASTAPGRNRAESTVAWLFSPFTESFDIGHGVPLSAPSCSISTKAKFGRALALLGLQPYLHHSQQNLLVQEDGPEWPMPIALTRNSQGWNFGLWDEQGRNNSYQSITFDPTRTTQVVAGSIWDTLGPAELNTWKLYLHAAWIPRAIAC